MRIKLAILESDTIYANRISAAFQARYADKLEIYSFTKEEDALAALTPSKIDVLLCGDSFEIETSRLPRRCGFAYLVDAADVETMRGEMAICKFQKAELIYKQILSLFSEKAGSMSGLRLNEDACTVIAFLSPNGGAGASTMAASCALHYAAQGKKVLYLNLERFGAADVFFQGEGQFGLSDVFYALKSKKTNLALKLESCVRRDPRGVYYYAQAQSALDICELKTEEIERLISEAMLAGSYEYLILDMDFSISKSMLELYRQAHHIVLVGDGSAVSNSKLRRTVAALNILEDQKDSPLLNRMVLLYNKFSNRSGCTAEDVGVKVIGGAPRFEHSSVSQLTAQISQLDVFEKL